MRKIFLFISVFVFCTYPVLAEPIIELAAPRVEIPAINFDEIPSVEEDKANKADSVKEVPKTKTEIKKKRKPRKKKPKLIKLDYGKVSKMIEYGYYKSADELLKKAISQNPKDIKAKALQIISLAKQLSLDPAQKELDSLLKLYPDNSDLHYAQGLVYYLRTTSSNMFYRNNREKLLECSRAEFLEAIKADKNNAKAYNAAGVLALKAGDTKKARDYFNLALSIDKTYSTAIDNLGTTDFIVGNYKEAKNKFQEALKYNTKNTMAMYHLAQVAFQDKDYKKALDYLNNALYINPESAAIYNLMGKTYVQQGNQAAAINAFRQSVAIKPEFTLSYLDLADVYNKRGDSEFAVEQLKTALSINPEYYDAKIKLADILFGSGKFKQSAKVYCELIGIEGYNDTALKGLANAYYGQAQTAYNKASIGSKRNLQEALKYVDKAIAINNKDLELHLAKLKLMKLLNQPNETLMVLNKIIESPANDLISNVIKGEAYLTLNDYENSQKYFNLAISLSKNTKNNLYLSEIFMYHRQLNCAETVLNKVIEKEPANQEAIDNLNYIKKCRKYADNYYNAAAKFLKSRNTSAAIDYLSRSIDINPNNAQAHLMLAKALEKQKDYDNALINYKAYLSLNPYGYDSEKIKKKIKKLDDKL